MIVLPERHAPRGRFRPSPLIPEVVASQDVGRTVHHYVRAKSPHCDDLWTGIFYDPADFDLFFRTAVACQIRGERIPSDIARLPHVAWQHDLFAVAGLTLVPYTCVQFRSVGDHVWRVPVYDPSWQDDADLTYLFDVAIYNASNTTNADWPTGNRAPASVTSVDCLVVAGGGGGGNGLGGGGGGGAGGLLHQINRAVVGGTSYTITVGAGGAGGSGGSGTPGSPGSNSVFDTSTALGGGGGAATTSSATGGNGGSGGGGGGVSSSAGGSATQGDSGGATGYGNNGGSNTPSSPAYGGGGGGGAGAVGSNGTATAGGSGGNGRTYSITGSSVTYAGGGGGGSNSSGNPAGSGGSGGGGAGGAQATGTSGTANTGGGGGGGGEAFRTGGSGGSGVVILSYTLAASLVFQNNAIQHMLVR